MRRATGCLLVVLFGSWLSTFGQSAPKTHVSKNCCDVRAVGSDERDEAGHDIHPATVGDVPHFRCHGLDRTRRNTGEFWYGRASICQRSRSKLLPEHIA